jgi:histidinol-phosphatase (PHP family)
VTEATRLKETYNDRITLLIGLETEVIRPDDDLAALRILLDRHDDRIDYIVGSVHHAAHVPIDFDRSTFDRALAACAGDLSRLHLDYFDAQHRLIIALQPEVIGHFDLCRLWEPGRRLDADAEVWAAVQRNVQAAVDYGALFEINAAAFRKGWSTAYPGEEVLQVCRIALCPWHRSSSDSSFWRSAASCASRMTRMDRMPSAITTERLWITSTARVSPSSSTWRQHRRARSGGGVPW